MKIFFISFVQSMRNVDQTEDLKIKYNCAAKNNVFTKRWNKNERETFVILLKWNFIMNFESFWIAHTKWANGHRKQNIVRSHLYRKRSVEQIVVLDLNGFWRISQKTWFCFSSVFANKPCIIQKKLTKHIQNMRWIYAFYVKTTLSMCDNVIQYKETS